MTKPKGGNRGRPISENASRHRVSVRLSDKDAEMLNYWSDKLDMTKTELLIVGLRHYVGWQNADYDLPTAEVARLNQLVEAVDTLTSNQKNMETTIMNGLDSVVGLVRGENYLADDGGDI